MQTFDKIIIKINSMQSGTILHLALLRKLSSNYSAPNYSRKFDVYRRERANLYSRLSPAPSSPSPHTFKQYEHSQNDSVNTSKYKSGYFGKTRKVRKMTPLMVKLIDEREDISGWNMQHQEQIYYFQKLKKNNFKLLREEIELNKFHKSKTRKFTFCQDNSNITRVSGKNSDYPILTQNKHQIQQIQQYLEAKHSGKSKTMREETNTDLSNKQNVNEKKSHSLELYNFQCRRTRSNQRSNSVPKKGRRIKSTLFQINKLL